MVRLLSFLIASLAATCSVLAAPQPGIYRISTIGPEPVFLTFLGLEAPVSFEPPNESRSQLVSELSVMHPNARLTVLLFQSGA